MGLGEEKGDGCRVRLEKEHNLINAQPHPLSQVEKPDIKYTLYVVFYSIISELTQ